MGCLKSGAIVVGWMLATAIVVVLLAYVPAGLGLVDSYRLGGLIAGLMLPVVGASFLAGLLFVHNQRRAAYALTGLVLLCVLLLDVYVVVASRG